MLIDECLMHVTRLFLCVGCDVYMHTRVCFFFFLPFNVFFFIKVMGHRIDLMAPPYCLRPPDRLFYEV